MLTQTQFPFDLLLEAGATNPHLLLILGFIVLLIVAIYFIIESRNTTENVEPIHFPQNDSKY